MVLFNYATKEITAKVVYYGPGLCGKTTNLQFVYDSLPSNNKSKMLSLATKTDRTLFFDNERLNPRNLPYFEAVAFKGTGVEATLKGITKQLFLWLSRYYGQGDVVAASAADGIGDTAPGPEPAP